MSTAEQHARPQSSEAPRRHVTINDVARLAGVSKKTVSRVINTAPSVRPDIRQRVEAVMSEVGYVPDPQARGLARGRAFLIGLVYDNPNPQYVVNMQLGLLDGLAGSGFELVVHPCDRGRPDFMETLRGFIERLRLSGVVLTPPVSEDEHVTRLVAEAGCAYVRIASVALDQPDQMIVTADRLGAREAGRHLGELGHARVGHISGPSHFRSSRERRAGFEEGLAACGVSLLEENVKGGTYGFASGVDGARELLTSPQPPSAIFAANDEMAAGVLQAARALGVRVPDDLSVVGFDDFEIASRVSPGLTTVRAPTHEIGRWAAQRLIGREEPAQDNSRWLPVLICRQSTARHTVKGSPAS